MEFDAPLSLAAFGFVAALPIYVSMIVLPLTSGYAGAALLTFASFASAMALMTLLTSLLVGLAKASLLRQLQEGRDDRGVGHGVPGVTGHREAARAVTGGE